MTMHSASSLPHQETRPRGGASRFSLDDYNLEIYLEAKNGIRLLTVGEVFAMSKDFVQIADDVISGVRLLREGAPEVMKR